MVSIQKKPKKTTNRQNQRTPLAKEGLKRIKEMERDRIPLDQNPAREENRQDHEFLFNTFHDMRNPLHAIMGYTSLVLRKTRDQIPEKQQENLEKVLQSAERLREIVDRMVAYYREK
jgi:Signal transduction histidine kinase